MWLDNESKLAVAYRLNESFYDRYDQPPRHQVEGALYGWITSIKCYYKGDFKELLSSLKNWRKEKLAYFMPALPPSDHHAGDD